jgi:4-amino-4-deoxy-L-arabinose transferase-like glycosyltransferase
MTSLLTSNHGRNLRWIGLIVFFLFAGVIGHDPWKWHEPYVFGVIDHFHATRTWLVPVNAGHPFLEKPPLYYWTGAIFCYLLGGFLPLADAARMASVFYMLIVAGFTWKTARVLFRESAEAENLCCITLALLLSQAGLARDCHMLQVDVALIAGVSVAFYGLALLSASPEKPLRGGFWLGLGTGAAFLAKGLFVPVILVMAELAQWALTPSLRSRRAACGYLLAILTALPFLVIWPLLIYQRSPEWFMEWFWDNNIGRFLGFSVDRLGVASPHFFAAVGIANAAFPAWIPALAEIFTRRDHWREPHYLLPLCLLVPGLALLSASASGAANYFIPLLPAFAFLGAPAMLRLPESAWRYVTLAVRAGFSLFAACLWLVWINLRLPPGVRPLPALAAAFGHWLPPHLQPPAQPVAVALALLIGLWWLFSFRLPARSAMTGAYTWLLATSLVWITAMTLLLPWWNAGKSYRPVFAQMESALRSQAAPGDCIFMQGYQEDSAPMFLYMVAPHFPPASPDCRFLFLPDKTTPAPESARLIWETPLPDAKRPEEILRLYRREP